MTFAITLAAVRKHKPCADAYARVSTILPKRGNITAQQARDAGCTYGDLVWIASAVAMNNEAIARRLTGYLNDNAKRVLHIWEERNPNDKRPRKAIEATDAWLAGTIAEAEWKDAARDARDAWAARDARAAWAAWAAWAARAARDAWAAWAAWAEFKTWQFDRLILWLSEEAPEPLPMPELVKEKAA
jgi:hypothetical protein